MLIFLLRTLIVKVIDYLSYQMTGEDSVSSNCRLWYICGVVAYGLYAQNMMDVSKSINVILSQVFHYAVMRMSILQNIISSFALR